MDGNTILLEAGNELMAGKWSGDKLPTLCPPFMIE